MRFTCRWRCLRSSSWASRAGWHHSWRRQVGPSKGALFGAANTVSKLLNVISCGLMKPQWLFRQFEVKTARGALAIWRDCDNTYILILAGSAFHLFGPAFHDHLLFSCSIIITLLRRLWCEIPGRRKGPRWRVWNDICENARRSLIFVS